jgi:hypothetical protein
MNNSDLISNIEQLQKDKNNLMMELNKLKRKPQRTIIYFLLFLGFFFIIVSILYSHNLSAFTGIALTFWGALLFYIRPTSFVRKVIIDSICLDNLQNIQQILHELDYKGTPRYLTQGTLEGLQRAVVYISKSQNFFELKDEHLLDEKMIITNPEAIKITPPGLGLSELFEEELRTNFSMVDLSYLKHHLNKVIVDGLEIAKSFEMTCFESNVHIEVKETIFDNIIRGLIREDMKIQIGDPLNSAIACVITRSTKRSVIIEKIEIDSKEKITKTDFKLI